MMFTKANLSFFSLTFLGALMLPASEVLASHNNKSEIVTSEEEIQPAYGKTVDTPCEFDLFGLCKHHAHVITETDEHGNVTTKRTYSFEFLFSFRNCPVDEPLDDGLIEELSRLRANRKNDDVNSLGVNNSAPRSYFNRDQCDQDSDSEEF